MRVDRRDTHALSIAALLLPLVLCSQRAAAGKDSLGRLFPKPELGLRRVDDKELWQTVSRQPFVLVLFDSPSCTQCRLFANSLQMAAAQLYEREVALVRIDALSHASVRQKAGVQTLPLLRLYVEGMAQDYDGVPDATDIVAFVDAGLRPPFKTVHSAAELEEVRQSTPYTVAACLNAAGREGDARYSDFQETYFVVARTLRQHKNTQFVAVPPEHAPVPEVCPDVWLFHDEFAEPEVFGFAKDAAHHQELANSSSSGALDEESVAGMVKSGVARDMTRWIRGRALPLYTDISVESAAVYLEAALPIVWAVVDHTAPPLAKKNKQQERQNDDLFGAVDEAMRKAAEAYHGVLTFVRLNRDLFVDQARDLNVADVPLPALVITDRHKFVCPSHGALLTEHELLDFVEQYLAGELSPLLRSEPVPSEEEARSSAVVKVVGTTWESVVHDESRDVFVLCYTDWCVQCDELRHTWASIARALQSVRDKLVLAEFDWERNEVAEHVTITGFPALLFYPAADKQHPVVYKGDVDEKDLLEFILLQRSFAWPQPSRMADIAFVEPEDVFMDEDEDEKDEL